MPPMVDMQHSIEDLRKEYDGLSDEELNRLPKYPTGLCIYFGNDELEKLDLDSSDVEVGDMIHLFCMARVTSVSKKETSDGEHQRIELQITHIADENESEEDEEEDVEEGRIHVRNPYDKE